MQLRFNPITGWPPLAWVARCTEADSEVVVAHGYRVETNPDWFVEGVWAGPFSEGGIDRTDLVFGSGGRASKGTITFVSPGSTVDRLVSCRIGECLYLSNSLVALCATLDLAVDPVSPRYYADFRSIVNGLEKYNDTLQTTRGPLRLTYFRNLTWDGHSLSVTEKPCRDRTFGDFAEYRYFLASSLAAIGGNMCDKQRRWPYCPLGTLSTGYDSPMVAVMARDIGNTEVLTFQRGRTGLADSGHKIAAQLGLTAIPLNRTSWRMYPFSAVPFLAADAYGEEAHYTAARPYLQGRVLLTGYHGDKVWDAGTHDLTPYIVRGDPTGLALTDWRLQAGFVHCPIPFFGVRNIAQIHQISTSEEMKPWSVGGDYDRPICRRIVENAGVGREQFGMTKSATSVVLMHPEEEFLPEESMDSYLLWLRRHAPEWLKRRRTPPSWQVRARGLAALLWRGKKLSPTDFYFYYLFPWALDMAKRRYLGMGPVFDL